MPHEPLIDDFEKAPHALHLSGRELLIVFALVLLCAGWFVFEARDHLQDSWGRDLGLLQTLALLLVGFLVGELLATVSPGKISSDTPFSTSSCRPGEIGKDLVT